MFIGDSIRPLSVLEDLELRRERIAELIRLDLVSPTLLEQLGKALTRLDQQIVLMKDAAQQRRVA
jgi:hypothetical protein